MTPSNTDPGLDAFLAPYETRLPAGFMRVRAGQIMSVRLAKESMASLMDERATNGALAQVLGVFSHDEDNPIIMGGMDITDLPQQFRPDRNATVGMVIVALDNGDWRAAFEFFSQQGETSGLFFPGSIQYNRSLSSKVYDIVGHMGLRRRPVPPGYGERWLQRRTNG